ncbi:anaphase-promoting complex subunit 10 isoform X2 [Oxyura jamaicensis]|nr:anaphase-promoting complex subunit 10 isoform X2 [Oxyura jamaicensis]
MTTPNKTPPGADPKQLERTGTVREIGSQAVWSLSSCKPGFGVDQLRDDNLETYWQSDGSQPHLVNIQFRRKTTVKTLCIYADYKSDESYTPSKISVRVGNNFHNLQEIRLLELVLDPTFPLNLDNVTQVEVELLKKKKGNKKTQQWKT